MTQLVIVESPAKAKTINKYLGSDYHVMASYGHIRDLPSRDGSVRPDDDFAVTYEINPDSAKNVKAIIEAVKKSDTLILATDPDREGEAISWHIIEALKEKKAIKKDLKIERVVFNEITKRAITEAIKNPRDVDMALVNAQQARRVLDYLVGFTLSPVLWRKLPGSKSAGRVQSVALRLIAEREAEIEAFKPQEYWDIHIDFLKDTAPFTAHLIVLDGKRLEKFSLPKEENASSVVEKLKTKNYSVSEVERKEVYRNPPPPFTTSTLQQEAARKLGFSAKYTMQLAQKLYEGVEVAGETTGLITYMRTDGVQVAGEAISAARAVIKKLYGENYVPGSARQYHSKAKNAQEAHEAIRPTDPHRHPDQVVKYLDQNMADLYKLIWKRLIASQMERVVLNQVSVDIISHDNYAGLRATGSTIKFDGFYALYREGRDDEEDEDQDKKLPRLEAQDKLEVKEIKPLQHFTEPPPRYSEASLVKKLEELGIGRPSTYASIISVLQDREYVKLEKKRFIAEDRGRLVTAFLKSFFPKYVEYDFTAHLEDELDDISAGELEWKEVLKKFWNEFHPATEEVMKFDMIKVIETLDHTMEPYLFPGDADIGEKRKCPTCESGRLGLKIGKFGAFLGCSNYPECKHTRALITESGEEEKDGDAEPRILGTDPKTNMQVFLKKGPYGFYVQLGEDKKPKRVGLLKTMDPATITLEQALALLSLPREVGIHPETKKKITAGVGRFGPYLQHDGAFTSIPKDDDVLTIGINRAVDIIAEKSAKGKSKRAQAQEPLKKLGEHPDGGSIEVFSGKYGPYIKHGKTNATLPKDIEPEKVTLDQAIDLLAAKAKKPKKKRG